MTTDTMHRSFMNRFLGAAFALADTMEREDIKAGDRIEVHLNPEQIAVLRRGFTTGDWLDGEKAAQQEGRGAYGVFGPVAIYRAPPRAFVRSDMPPHVQRMVAECERLRDDTVALVAFIESPKFQSIAPDERHRMERQRTTMVHYLNALRERIAAAGAQA